MRKHNKKFAQRWSREPGERSNFPQHMAHEWVHNKGVQYSANRLLGALLQKAGA